MKKFAVVLVIAIFACSASIAGANAPQFWPKGADGKPVGCFCCVKGTCVAAQNEADCKKIGGTKVEKCTECGKKAK